MFFWCRPHEPLNDEHGPVREVGLHDRLMASTYHPLWTIGVANLGLKYKFVDTGRFAFSAASAVTYVTSRILLRDLDPDQAVFDLVVVPVDVTGAARLHRDWTLSFASVITPVILRGNIDTDAIQGAAAVTNLQLHSTLDDTRLERPLQQPAGRCSVAHLTGNGS